MSVSLPRPAGAIVRRTQRAVRAVVRRARALAAGGDLLGTAAGLPVPVYLLDARTPAAQPTAGALPHRVMVCSVPKAGTYFVGEALRRLGSVPTGLHFSGDGRMLMDARFATREEARNEFGRLCHVVPPERVLPLVRPGQHALSHLECTPRVRALLTGFKVVFVYRDLRDAFVSWMRFHRDTGREARWNHIWPAHPDPRGQLVAFLREAGGLFGAVCRAMLPWLADPAAFRVRFETLHGDDGPEAQERLCVALAAFLGHAAPPAAPAAVLPGLTAAQTLTSSGARTRREGFWSDAAEDLFRAFGGAELNAALGYR